jgi:hypothetical protein
MRHADGCNQPDSTVRVMARIGTMLLTVELPTSSSTC